MNGIEKGLDRMDGMRKSWIEWMDEKGLNIMNGIEWMGWERVG